MLKRQFPTKKRADRSMHEPPDETATRVAAGRVLREARAAIEEMIGEAVRMSVSVFFGQNFRNPWPLARESAVSFANCCLIRSFIRVSDTNK